jgi:ACT domain-containing protein
MRAVITVIGKDKKGIIAGVSGELAANGVNILDISQTTLKEYFAMIMLVDLAEATSSIPSIQKILDNKGNELACRERSSVKNFLCHARD